MFYDNTDTSQLAATALQALSERSDLSADQNLIVLWLKESHLEGSKVQKLASTIVTKLLANPDLVIDQAWQIAISLYHRSRKGSDALQFTTNLLITIIKHPNLSIDQTQEIFASLNTSRTGDSDAENPANMLLSILLARPDLSTDQAWETAILLNFYSIEGSEAQIFAISTLLALISSSESVAKSKENVYSTLRKMVPQFHKLQSIKASYRSIHPTLE